jgi:signal transduction histidine kinase
VWVKARTRGRDVELIVEDSGPGVPPELASTIFEPFRQGDRSRAGGRGAGIGLSLVARFAELHGGRAWVDEREGGGASFKVFLTSPPPPSDASDEIAQESVTETANVP